MARRDDLRSDREQYGGDRNRGRWHYRSAGRTPAHDVGSYERSFWSEPSGGHQRLDPVHDDRSGLYGRGGYGWSGPDTAEGGVRHHEFRGRGPRVFRSDDRIREEVCERLSDDPYLDASNLEVQVHDAEVTLSGTVSSREDKRRAEMLAERIRGVRDVHNRLRLA